ncbi:MAG: response regulator transcription factor [Myxococcota bacterium]|nr:response regulator transcription factor [Myxococcota bacterium]
MQHKILIIEDDPTIALGLENALSISGYQVFHFQKAEDALREMPDWDLGLLDVMLPGMSGFDMLQLLKLKFPNRPVIMLTAKSTTRDVVTGLDHGADDYVTKPFQLSELLARVRARLRETENNQEAGVLMLSGVEVDLRRQIIKRENQELHLTTYENSVLQYLVSRSGQEISRQELLEEVWGYSPTMQTRTVDNQILKLRKKIEINPSRPKHILTVHGVGYRFEF